MGIDILIDVSGGKKPEFVGGGLMRSLGAGSCRQQLERHCRYQAKGNDFDWLVSRVATREISGHG